MNTATVANGNLVSPVAEAPKVQHVQGTPAVTSSREQAYRLGYRLMAGDWVVALLAVCTGLFAREWFREGAAADSLFGFKASAFGWSLGAASLYIWLMMFFRSYDPRNLYRFNFAMKNGLKSTLLCGVGMWAIVGLFNVQSFAPRASVLLSMLALLVLQGLWRLAAYAYMIQPKVREGVSSRVIVVGWNAQAERLREAMRQEASNLSVVIGCVPMPGGRFEIAPPSDVPVLGDYSALPEIAAAQKAGSVVLADVSCPSSEIQHLIRFCQSELLSFRLIPQYFPALSSGLEVQTMSGVPLLGIHRLPLERTRNRILKRVFDIAGALFGLTLAAPVIGVFALAVYLESPGPVIYRQLRTSRNGRNFFIYKIRSMKLNAETGTGAVWCKQQDDRRLKVGAFMRRTNVDELPQFFNVLKGDMSLVGPRPERPELIAKFKNQIPNYNARHHEVRAGLTGWAQVNGWRGDTDLSKRVEADLYYMENWSLMLDLYCMVATFFKVKNAY